MSSNGTAEKSLALFEKHSQTLQDATNAVHSRTFYARYPEPPSGRIYGETANDDGKAAFDKQLGNAYEGLLQDFDEWTESVENSPFTREDLKISYPTYANPNTYVDRAKLAGKEWRKASPDERAGILLESLENVKNRFFELAYATMHTTGQAFVMSFQASGPHSNDRALEAIALGHYEQKRFPESVEWVKPMGKFEVKLNKQYRAVAKGVGLCIGCSTFPVWNTTPGLYANLVTGNTAIVKPHPLSVYPIALVVDEIQKVLKANGYDPNICQLAVDRPDKLITKSLAENEDVKLIDFTGGNVFGDYVEGLSGKKTFTEKAGINSTVIESCADLKGMVQNISFSLSLYSGQMCTVPQNIFIPKSGIKVGDEQISYDDTVAALAKAVKGLVTHEKMGPGTLGAIQNDTTLNRISEAEGMGYKVILESMKIDNPEFPNARIGTTALIEVPADKKEVFAKEMFGPIAFIIPVEDAKEGVAIAKSMASKYGALTFSAYTTDADLQAHMTDEMVDSFTSISFNLVGPIWVNQSAGFSDFHVTGGNPAGNASLTDPEFVLGRFEIVGIRIHE